jgi:hypothetical protein
MRLPRFVVGRIAVRRAPPDGLRAARVAALESGIIAERLRPAALRMRKLPAIAA